MESRFRAAPTFAEFLDAAQANRDLWTAMARRATVPAEIVERVAALPGRWRLLVLNEDWCGDAVNTVPYVARLAEVAPNVELRLLGRDDNPDLMDAHLWRGSRSIPVVIVYDEEFVERGWWGPRPSLLQTWAVGEGRALEKSERYKEIRRWYARDGGQWLGLETPQGDGVLAYRLESVERRAASAVDEDAGVQDPPGI